MLKIRILILLLDLEKNMDKIGLVKEFDKLGRIVIPKELRGRYGLTVSVEIVATKEGILLKSQDYVLVEKKKQE